MRRVELLPVRMRSARIEVIGTPLKEGLAKVMHKLKTKKAILVCDFDNTIANLDSLQGPSFVRATEMVLGLKSKSITLTDKDIGELRGKNDRDILTAIAGMEGKRLTRDQIDRGIRVREEILLKLAKQKISDLKKDGRDSIELLEPGAKEFAQFLLDNGITAGISSNSPQPYLRYLLRHIRIESGDMPSRKVRLSDIFLSSAVVGSGKIRKVEDRIQGKRRFNHFAARREQILQAAYSLEHQILDSDVSRTGLLKPEPDPIILSGEILKRRNKEIVSGGREVIYIGDSRSDLLAALSLADKVKNGIVSSLDKITCMIVSPRAGSLISEYAEQAKIVNLELYALGSLSEVINNEN